MEKFMIEKMIIERDSISPKLFSAILEEIFKFINWDEVGIKLIDQHFNHIEFTDDKILFVSS